MSRRRHAIDDRQTSSAATLAPPYQPGGPGLEMPPARLDPATLEARLDKALDPKPKRARKKKGEAPLVLPGQLELQERPSPLPPAVELTPPATPVEIERPACHVAPAGPRPADYSAFLTSKAVVVPATGFEPPADLGDHLFAFQADLVRWALRRGRAAIFADTGLGKSRQQLTWAREVARFTGGRVLILAPLAVASQTTKEGKAIGIDVTLCREASDVGGPGIYITNYERVHKFDPSLFDGVVLDESSVIKHSTAKTFTQLTEAFANTRFKLCATATPAPNDWAELGTHAEFLGVCSRVEMLAEYFEHDGGETSKWTLKGHGRELFWKWVSGWGAVVRKPSDLGYDDAGYDLPPLDVRTHILESDEAPAAGMLFAVAARGLTEQRAAKRASLPRRVARVVELANAEPGEPWVIWCELNAEQDALADALGEQAVSIQGSDSPEEKSRLHDLWMAGERRILISKSSIFGWGLNWQHAARMSFVGVTHSYESFYQAVRREYRFGQKRPVVVHVVCSETETEILASLQRKQQAAEAMSEQLASVVHEALMANVRGQARQTNPYEPRVPMALPAWLKSEERAA